MPMQAKADIKCSTVATRTPLSSTKVEDRRVSLTKNGWHFNLGVSGKSVRLKIMP